MAVFVIFQLKNAHLTAYFRCNMNFTVKNASFSARHLRTVRRICSLITGYIGKKKKSGRQHFVYWTGFFLICFYRMANYLSTLNQCFSAALFKSTFVFDYSNLISSEWSFIYLPITIPM